MQRAAHCWPRAVAVRVSGITQVWQPIRAADRLTSLLTCICGSPRLLHRYTSVSDRCRCIAVRDNSHGIAREWTGCAGGVRHADVGPVGRMWWRRRSSSRRIGRIRWPRDDVVCEATGVRKAQMPVADLSRRCAPAQPAPAKPTKASGIVHVRRLPRAELQDETNSLLGASWLAMGIC